MKFTFKQNKFMGLIDMNPLLKVTEDLSRKVASNTKLTHLLADIDKEFYPDIDGGYKLELEMKKLSDGSTRIVAYPRYDPHKYTVYSDD